MTDLKVRPTKTRVAGRAPRAVGAMRANCVPSAPKGWRAGLDCVAPTALRKRFVGKRQERPTLQKPKDGAPESSKDRSVRPGNPAIRKLFVTVVSDRKGSATGPLSGRREICTTVSHVIAEAVTHEADGGTLGSDRVPSESTQVERYGERS